MCSKYRPRILALNVRLADRAFNSCHNLFAWHYQVKEFGQLVSLGAPWQCNAKCMAGFRFFIQMILQCLMVFCTGHPYS